MIMTGSGCVAQLLERSLPIPEVRGSNQVIGKIYWTFVYCQLCIEKTKIKKKRGREWPIFKKVMMMMIGYLERWPTNLLLLPPQFWSSLGPAELLPRHWSSIVPLRCHFRCRYRRQTPSLAFASDFWPIYHRQTFWHQVPKRKNHWKLLFYILICFIRRFQRKVEQLAVYLQFWVMTWKWNCSPHLVYNKILKYEKKLFKRNDCECSQA